MDISVYLSTTIYLKYFLCWCWIHIEITILNSNVRIFGSFDVPGLNVLTFLAYRSFAYFLSVCRGLEENETFVDFLFRRFVTWLYCLLLYLSFVGHWMSWFEGINENQESWCSTNKNKFTVYVRKRKWWNLPISLNYPSLSYATYELSIYV